MIYVRNNSMFLCTGISKYPKSVRPKKSLAMSINQTKQRKYETSQKQCKIYTMAPKLDKETLFDKIVS